MDKHMLAQLRHAYMHLHNDRPLAAMAVVGDVIRRMEQKIINEEREDVQPT